VEILVKDKIKLKQWLDLVSLNLQSCFVFSGGFTAGR
jgi:hypothetical protein